MPAKRIIPCLDIQNGETVKGINFNNLKSAGNPAELAARYAADADELVLLDITATLKSHKIMLDLIRQIARIIDIPFTVGGGIQHISDVENLLSAGADKIAINSAALYKPDLIDELARQFGSQCIVLAADIKPNIQGEWQVYTRAGTIATGRQAEHWCKEAEQRGAGEILLTSMAHDGTGNGFALDILQHISSAITIPVIASGGAGNPGHFLDLFRLTACTGALAASIFHFNQLSIKQVKNHLMLNNIKPLREIYEYQ